MIRMILGAAASAVAMFVIGFIFFGPLGLHNLAVGNLTDNQAAAVQQALAANLPATGTYFVPEAEESAAQTVMYGQGPIATVHYNTAGFAAVDAATLGIGLAFNFLIALVMGLALIGIDGRVTDFGSRARVAVILARGRRRLHPSERADLLSSRLALFHLCVRRRRADAGRGRADPRLVPAPPNGDDGCRGSAGRGLEQGEEARGGVEIAPAGRRAPGRLRHPRPNARPAIARRASRRPRPRRGRARLRPAPARSAASRRW